MRCVLAINSAMARIDLDSTEIQGLVTMASEYISLEDKWKRCMTFRQNTAYKMAEKIIAKYGDVRFSTDESSSIAPGRHVDEAAVK